MSSLHPAMQVADALPGSTGGTDPEAARPAHGWWVGQWARQTGQVVTSTPGVWIAVATVTLWCVVLNLKVPEAISDEGIHLKVVQQMVWGHFAISDRVPMIPGYHLLLAVPSRVFGVHPVVGRVMGVGFAICTAVMVSLMARRLGFEQRTDRVLHWIWLPPLFVLWPMVFTEGASVAFLAAGVCAQVHGRRYLAAGSLLASCAMRQSHLVWVALIVAWMVLERIDRAGGLRRASGDRLSASRPNNRPGAWVKSLLSELWPYALILSLITGFLVFNGGMLAGRSQRALMNAPRFNLCQFFAFAVCWLALWSPVWLPETAAGARAVRSWAGRYPARAAFLAAVGLGTALILALAFDNSHPWNHDRPMFLRNRLLAWLEFSMVSRLAGGLLMVFAAGVAAAMTWKQPRAALLGLVWLFSLFFLSFHWLVEPRYYIVPLLLLATFSDLSAVQARRMTLSCGVLNLLIAAGTLRGVYL